MQVLLGLIMIAKVGEEFDGIDGERLSIGIEQFVLLAAEEGIFSFNLNEIHDATMDLVSVIFFE